MPRALQKQRRGAPPSLPLFALAAGTALALLAWDLRCKRQEEQEGQVCVVCVCVVRARA